MKKDIRTTITEENLTNKERIDAIVWKARQSGMSYGEFAATLTSSSKSSVFEEYAAVLQAFREEQKRIEEAYIQSKKRGSTKRNRDITPKM